MDKVSIDSSGGDQSGPREPIHPRTARRALVMILEESPAERPSETALLSDAALAKDWNRPEEDEAWSHLQ